MSRRTRVLALFAVLLVPLAVVSGLSPTGAEAEPRATSPLIAVVGDFGNRSDDERDVAALVTDLKPSAVVTTGDNIYSSTDFGASVGRYYCGFIADATSTPDCPTSRMARTNSFFPATGNHDYSDGGIDAYRSYFGALGGRTTYAFTRGGIEFLDLDSQAALDSPTSMDRQRRWLRDRARSSAARWQAVVLHHPPYSSGSVHGSTPQFQWPYASWGVDLVLSGHDHDYERLARGGVTYVVNGIGGAPLYAFGTPLPGSAVRIDDKHGALVLRSANGRLLGELLGIDGERLDAFSVGGGTSRDRSSRATE